MFHAADPRTGPQGFPWLLWGQQEQKSVILPSASCFKPLLNPWRGFLLYSLKSQSLQVPFVRILNGIFGKCSSTVANPCLDQCCHLQRNVTDLWDVTSPGEAVLALPSISTPIWDPVNSGFITIPLDLPAMESTFPVSSSFCPF